MAHEIESSDTVVLGKNEVAWHGLGKLFPGLLSPLRVFAEGVGARDIVEVPVSAGPAVVPGYKALVAVDDNLTNPRPLSVVGDRYGVLKDGEFFAILDRVYGGRAVINTAGTLRGGKRIWALAERPSFEVTAGDTVRSFDLWVNRHDGSGSFELHRTNVRVVCANTWRQAIGRGQDRVLGVRHTTNVLANAQAAVAALAKADESELYAQAGIQRLVSKSMTVDGAAKVFEGLLGIERGEGKEAPGARTQNQLDTLVNLFRRGSGTEGRTAWDAFNAVTEFVDHHRTIRAGAGRDRVEARFESAMFGSGDDLKASAYDLLLTVN